MHVGEMFEQQCVAAVIMSAFLLLLLSLCWTARGAISMIIGCWCLLCSLRMHATHSGTPSCRIVVWSHCNKAVRQ